MDCGGAEMRTIQLMPLLASRGVHFDFCVVSPGKGQLDDQIYEMGGKIFACQLKPDILNFQRKFPAFLKQSDYDIVHCHGHLSCGYILYLSHKAGIKGRIAHFRSIGDGKNITIKRKIYHNIMRRMANKYATAILAVCHGAMECVWKQDWQNDSRCRVIYNGLDVSVFDNTPIDRKGVKHELGIPEKSTLIINVGRFNYAKAHDILLSAAKTVFALNNEIYLLLVGDGELRK